MRRLIIAILMAALLPSAAALAAGRTGGTVASVNPIAGVLVLADGRSFVFRDVEMLRKLTPGQPIGVSYFGEGQGTGTFDPCICSGVVPGNEP